MNQRALNIPQLDLEGKLASIKQIDFSKPKSINIYLASVSPRNKKKRIIDIKRLRMSNEALNRLSSTVAECILGTSHIVEMRQSPTIADNRFFYIEKSATDCIDFETAIQDDDIDYISKIDELQNFNTYITQVVLQNNKSVFGYAYIGGMWSTNKSSGNFLKSMFDLDGRLTIDISSEQKFTMKSQVDFIQYEDGIFISDVGNFETSMNFHERLIEKRDEAMERISASKAISINSLQNLKNAVKSDKYLMRQLTSVHAKGYYADHDWLGKLKNAAENAATWKIKFDCAGSIIIEDDKDYIKEVLTLLQNKRVQTVVDQHIFDVDGELIPIG